MAKVYTGRDGELIVAGSTVAKVVGFNFQANLETLETTTLGDNLRSYTPGVVGYSGTCTLLYYSDGSSKNISSLLRDSKLIVSGASGVSASNTVTLKLRLDKDNSTEDIQLNAYITNASIGVQTGDITRADVSFTATGSLSTVTIY